MIPSRTIRNLGLLYLAVMILILTLGSFVQARFFSPGLILTEVVCILVPAVVYLRLTRAPLSMLRPRPVSLPVVMACLLLGAGVWLVDSALDMLFAALFGYSILLPADAYPTTAVQAVLVFAALAVFAPVCEEVLFRGVMLRGLQLYGARFAILASSLLFAFFHFRLQGLAALLPAAFVLGYTAWRSGSLFASMLVHFVNNAISAGLLIYSASYPGQNLPLSLPVMVAGGGLILAGGVWLLKRFTSPEQPLPAPQSEPGRPEKRSKKDSRSRRASRPPTLAGTLWPLVLAALLYLGMAGVEWFSQKRPEVMAAGRVLDFSTLRAPAAGHYRYDVTNIVGDAVGHTNYQVISIGGQTSLVGSEQVQAFNVQYLGGTWISQSYSKTWSSQPPTSPGLAESFEWQFHTGEELYTAQSDGKQATIQYGSASQAVTPGLGALLSEELLLRGMSLPFSQGYIRLVDAIQLIPMKEQTKIEPARMAVNVLGGEPIRVPAGDFIAWRVKIGPNLTAWYDRKAPHRLLRYESAGVTSALH